MKKITLILLVAASSVWSGCSKKNEATPLTPDTATVNDLVGKWNATKIIQTDSVGNSTTTSTTETLDTGDYYFQFNSDNTGYNGGTISGNGPFTYSVSGGVIQITSANQTKGLTIMTITRTTLTLRIAVNEGEDEDLYFSK